MRGGKRNPLGVVSYDACMQDPYDSLESWTLDNQEGLRTCDASVTSLACSPGLGCLGYVVVTPRRMMNVLKSDCVRWVVQDDHQKVQGTATT